MFTIEQTQFKAAFCAVGRCPPVLFIKHPYTDKNLCMANSDDTPIAPLVHRNQPHSTHIPIIA